MKNKKKNKSMKFNEASMVTITADANIRMGKNGEMPVKLTAEMIRMVSSAEGFKDFYPSAADRIGNGMFNPNKS